MNDFDSKISEVMPGGLQSKGIEVLQINLGRRCNLSCAHCHLECSPDRPEAMAPATMEKILQIVQEEPFSVADITGGSPELHPHFRTFIEALRQAGQRVQVRTNFAALEDTGLEETCRFLHREEVLLVGSMPCYLGENVDSQRGEGAYEKSIRTLRQLNSLGYGLEGGQQLNIVHNPGGPSLPGKQSDLEDAYRSELRDRFNIQFNRLHVITNMPIGRFGKVLVRLGKREDYLRELRNAFNQGTLEHLMCRTQVCIDWDGTLFDCDFNLALGMPINHQAAHTIDGFDRKRMEHRRIVTGMHCFGCTAGAGSSCKGALVE